MSEEITTEEEDGTVTPPEVKPQPDAAVSEDGGDPPAEAKTPDSKTPEHMIPKSRLDEVLEQQKKLKEQLAEIQAAKDEAAKAQEKAEQQTLEEQGKWQELFEQERVKLDKLEAKRQKAESDAKIAQQEMLRIKVASSLSGFPSILTGRLQGETEEELRADAQTILDNLPHTPAVETKTDAKTGINGKVVKPAKTDLEIQEEAARTGVSFEHLKQHYEQQSLKQ